METSRTPVPDGLAPHRTGIQNRCAWRPRAQCRDEPNFRLPTQCERCWAAGGHLIPSREIVRKQDRKRHRVTSKVLLLCEDTGRRGRAELAPEQAGADPAPVASSCGGVEQASNSPPSPHCQLMRARPAKASRRKVTRSHDGAAPQGPACGAITASARRRPVRREARDHR